MLRDAEGSVATRLSDSGNVKSHSAYDPYGASNDAGSGIAVGERDPETELGYQAESADAVTGNILVGPRQYDPTTQRFTSADVFIDDLSLATDPLTGNRYLFAAANPVALDDDGHAPACGASSAACESSSDTSRGRTPTSADREYTQGGSSIGGGGSYSSGASVEFVVIGGGSGYRALFAAVMMPIYREPGGGPGRIPVGPLGPLSRPIMSASTTPRAATTLPSGLRGASPGLRRLFPDQGFRGRSIISVRSTLRESGWGRQQLAGNRQGYLFRGSGQENVRIMRAPGGWEVRIQNRYGNYLDEWGNVPAGGGPAHGIGLRSR